MSTDRENEIRAELEAWSREANPSYGRKLTFSEKCGIAYILHRKALKPSVIAEAFNLSRATISQLAHCLSPQTKHYREVWQEFDRLGEEEFERQHYLALHARVRAVRAKMLAAAPRQEGPDPRADKYATAANQWHVLPDGSRWQIFFRDTRENPAYPPGLWPHGWYFASLMPIERHDGPWHIRDENSIRGAESMTGEDAHIPFRTSSAAYDGMWDFMGFENPRAKPGRPSTLRQSASSSESDPTADKYSFAKFGAFRVKKPLDNADS